MSLKPEKRETLHLKPKDGAQTIGELSVKLADAALVARERGDDVHAIFFAIKAAECLTLAKALGWKPSLPEPPKP